MQVTGTTAVAAGAVSVTIVGSFGSGYQVSVAPSWVTAYSITGKTAAQFVVTFAVPAPAGGGSLDWDVFGGTLTSPGGYDTFANWKADVLDRAGQAVDGTSSYDLAAMRLLIRAYQELCFNLPYQFLKVAVPAAFNTVAPITAGTVQVTNGSTAITFSQAPGTDQTGKEIFFGGWNEVYRIAANAGGGAVATLDVAFNGPTNAVSTYTLFQRDYDITVKGVAGFNKIRHLVEMYAVGDAWPIEQRDQKWIRDKYPDPPASVWPPQYFARVTDGITTTIRFEGYPSLARRIEFSYTQIPDDPDANPILLPRGYPRIAVCDLALYWLFLEMNDDRADAAGTAGAVGKQLIDADDDRKHALLGSHPPRRGLYQ